MIRYADASMVVALISRQKGASLVDQILRDAVDRIVVSDFALAESSAALARLGRVERWSDDRRTVMFGELDAWALSVATKLEITTADIEQADVIVRAPDIALRAPDAIHIAAARRLNATLLTLDKGMARAAAALSVPHINPAEATDPANRKTE